jgi:hypothetical protein
LWGWILLAVGCGGPDLEGLYQVTSQVVAEDGCANEIPVTDGDPYFRIVKTDFLGADIHSPQSCETTDPESCSSLGFLAFLADEIDDGYAGQTASASGSNGQCLLGFLHYQATLDGDTVTFVAEQYGEEISSATCDADQAAARGRAMPCLTKQVIVGTRVK